MTIPAAQIKELRTQCGAGIMDCRNALIHTSGDMEKALEILKEKGLAKAQKKSDRATTQGLLEAYVHTGGRIGAMVELNCETDFVARTDEFKELAHSLAMQVVAARPQYVKPEDIPAKVLEKEEEEYRAQLADQKKAEHIMEKIIEGKLKKFCAEVCILNQPFIRDQDKTVQDVINDAIAAMGENIVLRRFVRLQLSEA